MATVHIITGGQRSGKSSFAQNLALELSPNPTYLATSRIWDEDFKNRVQRHKDDRGEQWENIEEEKQLDALDLKGKTVVIDCITLWLTNIFHDNNSNIDKSLHEAKAIWNKLIQQDCTLLVVSNEIGMSMHAETELGRKFTDLQGWVNQHIAKNASQVTLMVSGIPVKIK